jgi:hypothetical protein
MTGLKAFNLLADCVSYCHENFVCYQTDPIADSLLLSIDINNDSFLTYKRVKQKLYPSVPTQCYLANCESLLYSTDGCSFWTYCQNLKMTIAE